MISYMYFLYGFQEQYPLAKQVLRQALEVKRGDKVYYWQFRLFFQLAVSLYTANVRRRHGWGWGHREGGIKILVNL